MNFDSHGINRPLGEKKGKKHTISARKGFVERMEKNTADFILHATENST